MSIQQQDQTFTPMSTAVAFPDYRLPWYVRTRTRAAVNYS